MTSNKKSKSFKNILRLLRFISLLLLVAGFVLQIIASNTKSIAYIGVGFGLLFTALMLQWWVSMQEYLGRKMDLHLVSIKYAGIESEDELIGPYDIILQSVGKQRMMVLKTIREIYVLGLADGRDLIRRAPVTLKSGVSKKEAEYVKKRLEQFGASVKIIGDS
ncbi:MAG: ribosomal protein L7/L12 [Armatimonadota bacterium]